MFVFLYAFFKCVFLNVRFYVLTSVLYMREVGMCDYVSDCKFLCI